MGKRYTASELDARLKFLVGSVLASVLLTTTIAILYALIFVTQPIGEQSENDKMFFSVLSSIATFITGTLAGLMIGQNKAAIDPDKDESKPESETPDIFEAEEGGEQQ
jgi:heme A synthase